jgi:polysaccharide biosynthesis protein PslH
LHLENNRLKVAFFVSRFPFPLDRGDKLRVYYQIIGLSQNADVYLISIDDIEVSNEMREALEPYCKKILCFKKSHFDTITGLGIGMLKGWPFQTGVNYSYRFKKDIDHFLQDHPVDIIYCQLIRMASYCESLQHKKVIDFMDAMGNSMLKRSKISSFPLNILYRWESRRAKKYETRCIEKFDAYTVITDVDAVEIGLQNYEVIANGIETKRFYKKPIDHKKYDIGFLGNLGYPPNQEAVALLLDSVIPRYDEKYKKSLKVLIGGARASNSLLKRADENIHIVGWIDDMNDAYNEIRIFCMLYYQGTGQQNKILEAMACGVPVICNHALNVSIGAPDNVITLINTLFIKSRRSIKRNFDKRKRFCCGKSFLAKSIRQII